MTLRLNSTGGGHIEIDAPNTASNFSLTVPIANGTLDTTGRAGNILQVVTSNHQFLGTSPILVSKDATEAASQYGSTIEQRAYGDLASVTITPTYSDSILLINAQAGMHSLSRAAYGAQGVVIVKDNTSIYENSTYPHYDSTYLQTAYPGDNTITLSIPAVNTNPQTFYLKGFAYNETSSTGSHVARFTSHSLSVMEVKA